MIHVANTAKPNHKLSANKMPAAVATPLPPKNLKNIGNKWPKNTAMATPATAQGSKPHSAK